MKATTSARFRRRRAIKASLLLGGAIAVGGILAVFFSWTLVALYFAALPVPLFVFWFASTTPDPQTRLDAANAAREAEPPPRSAPR